MNQGDDEVPKDGEIELGAAVQARLKAQRNLTDLQAAAAEGQELVEELETIDVHLAHQRQTAVKPQHDDAARVGQVPIGPGRLQRARRLARVDPSVRRSLRPRISE